MTDETSAAAASTSTPANKPGGGAGKLVGRIILYGALGVLVVLAVLDYRAKTAATATGDKWRSVLAEREGGEAGPSGDLKYAELSEYIEGDPVVSSDGAATRSLKGASKRIESYTWNGVFRDYVVNVGVGLGQGEPIVGIEGPGEVIEQEAPVAYAAGPDEPEGEESAEETPGEGRRGGRRAGGDRPAADEDAASETPAEEAPADDAPADEAAADAAPETAAPAEDAETPEADTETR